MQIKEIHKRFLQQYSHILFSSQKTKGFRHENKDAFTIYLLDNEY